MAGLDDDHRHRRQSRRATLQIRFRGLVPRIARAAERDEEARVDQYPASSKAETCDLKASR